MTDFRKYNRSPSFRGVPFHVREDDYSGGRRNETHEYPGGERAMTEDLGRKAHQITLSAFVNGEDWRDQTERLIAALEKRGPGELVHPNGKTYVVCVDSFHSRESTALFETTFEITFIESGEQPAPMVSVSLTDRLVSAADTLDIANALEFVKIAADYVASNAAAVASVAASVVNNVAAIVDSVQSAADTITDAMDEFVDVALALDDLAKNVESLLETPSVWAARVKAATDVVTGLIPSNKKNVQSLIDMSKTPSADLSKIDQSTTKGMQQYRAVARTNNFNITKSVTSAARTLSTLETDKRADVHEILDNLLDAVDAVLGTDIAMSPDFTIALSDISAAAMAVCNDYIAKLPEETEMTLMASVPARVLAHRLYNDQSRGDEIAAENFVANPTFIPAGTPIKVLKS